MNDGFRLFNDIRCSVSKMIWALSAWTEDVLFRKMDVFLINSFAEAVNGHRGEVWSRLICCHTKKLLYHSYQFKISANLEPAEMTANAGSTQLVGHHLQKEKQLKSQVEKLSAKLDTVSYITK